MTLPTALLLAALLVTMNAVAWVSGRTTPPIPTPPSCTTSDGHMLVPGETYSKNCLYCQCESHSGLSCYNYDCLSPMCVDPVSSGDNCCWTCPNGDNCKIEQTGEVIPAGSPVVRGSLVCNCPPQDYYLPGRVDPANSIALCQETTTPPTPLPTTIPTTPPPPPTTPPPSCTTDDGYTLQPGESRSMNCKVCTCEFQGHLSCYYYDCLSPMCVDPVDNGDNCCWTCPNGKNCRIQQTGEVIPAGSPVVRGSLTCSCPPQDYSLPGRLDPANSIAQCQEMTTVPPTTIPATFA